MGEIYVLEFFSVWIVEGTFIFDQKYMFGQIKCHTEFWIKSQNNLAILISEKWKF